MCCFGCASLGVLLWVCCFGYVNLNVLHWMCYFGCAALDLLLWMCYFGCATFDVLLWMCYLLLFHRSVSFIYGETLRELENKLIWILIGKWGKSKGALIGRRPSNIVR